MSASIREIQVRHMYLNASGTANSLGERATERDFSGRHDPTVRAASLPEGKLALTSSSTRDSSRDIFVGKQGGVEGEGEGTCYQRSVFVCHRFRV